MVILRQPTAALEENKSNLTSASGEVSASSNQRSFASPNPNLSIKKKRNPPGNPDPDAEVIALSPKTLLATNRFVCEICNKGFQRDQNLQLHRRGHNLPWKLRQRNSKEVRKKVYICPEVTCVHHEPSRALGDLTGIKKHFSRKHGEKKWKCDKCSKKYAVQSDWKAHSKTCGTREYRCDCGTLFSRRDSFITHRAFCDVLAEESTRVCTAANPLPDCHHPLLLSPATIPHDPTSSSRGNPQTQFPFSAIAIDSQALEDFSLKREQQHQLSLRPEVPSWLAYQAPPAQGSFINFDFLPSLFPTSSPLPPRTFHPSLHMSATALLQKAAQMGSTISSRSDRSQMAAHTGGGDSTAVFGLSSSSHINMEGFRPGSQPPSSVQHMVMSSFPSSSHQEGYSLTHGNGWVIGSRGDVDDGGGGGASSSAAAAADGMTRDFLGLRALSHGDILSMAARLGPCVSSSSYEPLQHCKKPWTG
ncbi:unnamed protein product [Spirodela intermedia]|uniref:Protein EARLY HEADING DATE 2 n=1 Tax=Spirodela intermedia TaxID=51605 RepID=A0A7I8KJC5_SPIIN|nr:unnamed protein product [Spirodela intermedia]